jgi:hypothetical protein
MSTISIRSRTNAIATIEFEDGSYRHVPVEDVEGFLEIHTVTAIFVNGQLIKRF